MKTTLQLDLYRDSCKRFLSLMVRNLFCFIQDKQEHNYCYVSTLIYNISFPQEAELFKVCYGNWFYFMAGSMSGKMNQIWCCDWLTRWARCCYLALVTTRCILPENKNIIVHFAFGDIKERHTIHLCRMFQRCGLHSSFCNLSCTWHKRTPAL